MSSIMPFRSVVFIMPFLCLALLTNCTKVADSHLQVNQQLVSPYSMPAQTYLAMAKNQSGLDAQKLRLMAAGRLIHDGHWQQGRMILTRMSDLPGALTDEKYILMAKIDLIREQPRAAIANLAKVGNKNQLTLYYQAQYHELLAEAYQETSHAAESVSERIKLGGILPDKASKSDNLRALWLTLTTLPASELNTLAVEMDGEAELKGWMELAVISRKNYQHPNQMVAAIESWQAHYHSHPANTIIHPSKVDSSLFPTPHSVALLLPLTGPLAGPGNAIKDGFMTAHSSSQSVARTTVRLYDTNSQNVTALYKKAVDEGADYIVGPLKKTDVAAVAALKHPVPTLLLNDSSTHTSNNTYQFGLSPGSEARQVAVKARRNGYTRALVIAPEGSWGDEVVQEFSSQWQANGGHVVDRLFYKSNDNMNASIRDFLHISNSEARNKELKSILGKKIESTPRRRQDFDMIFLLAYPGKAREIMPLLKYYYAGDMPVYATSSVYAGSPNAMKDRDLNGIIFCDMPWVFKHQMGHKNWPEQFNSYNRLYALGMDSYALSRQLNQLLLFPAMGVRDKSGVLYLNSKGQVARILAWGQFKQGLAVPA